MRATCKTSSVATLNLGQFDDSLISEKDTFLLSYIKTFPAQIKQFAVLQTILLIFSSFLICQKKQEQFINHS